MAGYEEIVGKICGVELSDGVKSDGTKWNRASIKIDTGEKYPITVATFDTNLIDFANKYNGKKVKAKYQKSGQYNNLIKEGLELWKEEEAQPEVKEEVVEDKPQEEEKIKSTKTPESMERVAGYQKKETNKEERKQRLIVRQNSYSHAFKVFEIANRGDFTLKDVKKIAHEIEEDIMRFE